MNYNVSAKLCTSPNFKRPEIIYLTRGVSGMINFDIYNKAYCFDDIEQLTFMLRETNGKLHVYDAIEYFTPAVNYVSTTQYYMQKPRHKDTALEEIRYEPVPKSESKAEDINYYFIAYKPEDTALAEAKMYWQLNDHFTYSGGKDYEYISFLLRGKETLEFTDTNLDSLIEFEIAVKLNTDSLLEQAYDAVIIEKQAPIGVISSLYSQIAGDRQ